MESLSKTYADGTTALKGVSFTLRAGEFVAVLGKSGSGKSTLLRCINRLVEPTSGRVFFNGREVTGAGPRHLRSIRKKTGMIFQQYNLVNRLSVLTNVLSGRLGYLSPWAGLLNFFPRGVVEIAHKHLANLGVDDKCFQRAQMLSGGQQQRVGIGRALMQDPALILADEPVSNLDPATSRNIMDILKDINQNGGVTILCNLHLPDLAKEYGRRILALKQGELIFDGTPESLDEALPSIY